MPLIVASGKATRPVTLAGLFRARVQWARHHYLSAEETMNGRHLLFGTCIAVACFIGGLLVAQSDMRKLV